MVIQSIKPEDGLFCCASGGDGNFTEIGGAWRSVNIYSLYCAMILEKQHSNTKKGLTEENKGKNKFKN